MNNIDQVSVRLKTEKTYYSNTSIGRPEDAVKLMVDEFHDLDREAFLVLNLDVKNRPININVISMGSLDMTIVHPREIFKVAILSNASKMLLLHNHPSGGLEPSENDLKLTNILIKASNLLGIGILDHIIFNNKKELLSIIGGSNIMLEHDEKEI